VGPALAATIIKLAPLTDRNAEFSEQVLLVYQAYLELFG
jgi:toxin-antitoxin system, toxin component, fic family